MGLRDLHRFWLERFTVDEICELGGGLLLFADEDVGWPRDGERG